MALFSVVEFTGENAVEVVPTTWIDKDLKHCYFKSGPSVASVRRDPNSRPSATWPRYEIKIRSQHGNVFL